MRMFVCRHEKYYCEYMYCLYTAKRKLSVENITFLKNVQNITIVHEIGYFYHLVGHNLVQ